MGERTLHQEEHAAAHDSLWPQSRITRCLWARL